MGFFPAAVEADGVALARVAGGGDSGRELRVRRTGSSVTVTAAA